MTDIDTSTEAVEAMAARLHGAIVAWPEAATLLRSLAAERDRLRDACKTGLRAVGAYEALVAETRAAAFKEAEAAVKSCKVPYRGPNFHPENKTYNTAVVKVNYTINEVINAIRSKASEAPNV